MGGRALYAREQADGRTASGDLRPRVQPWIRKACEKGAPLLQLRAEAEVKIISFCLLLLDIIGHHVYLWLVR